MITRKMPEDWRNLQRCVARILSNCGWQVEIEHPIQTARGRVEIDVDGEENVDGRRYRVLCECKYWRQRVPQSVVHSFRTIVSDAGANAGYIISTSGFQSGAFEAIKNSNVKLVSWPEFQDDFEDTWVREWLTKAVKQNIDPLASYLEPLPAMVAWDHYLDDADIEELKRLHHANFELGGVLLSLHPGPYRVTGGKPSLPIRETLRQRYSDEKIRKLGLPDSLLDETAYLEFYEELLAYGLPLLQTFRQYRNKAQARKYAQTGNSKIRGE